MQTLSLNLIDDRDKPQLTTIDDSAFHSFKGILIFKGEFPELDYDWEVVPSTNAGRAVGDSII